MVLLRQIGHDLLWKKQTKQENTTLKNNYTTLPKQASSKLRESFELEFPLRELVSGMRAEIETCFERRLGHGPSETLARR